MNKLSLYVILLSGLCFGVTTASAKSSSVNKLDTELHNQQKVNMFGVTTVTKGVTAPFPSSKPTLEPSKKVNNSTGKLALQASPLPNALGKNSKQVWVINQNQPPQQQPFNWIVPNPQEVGKQPLLVAQKTPEKPNTKPNTSSKPPKKDDLEAFDEVIKDTEKQQGLFTLYRQKEKNKIYLEIQPEQLNKNYLATSTLESGIGEQGIYSGMPLQDFLFYFKRIDNNLQFTVRNVNFRTKEGDPQARSLARSFSDSILYTIPIKSIHPERKTLLIDLGDLLLTDLAGLSLSLGIPGGTDQSYFGNAKAFPENIEVQTVLNFSGGGSSSSRESEMLNFESLADSRGFTLRIHYSLSQLPNNKYQPRLADERVGYFITAYQDLSKDDRGDPFVRYINRWNLEKEDPQAPISRPKKPIVFWIDNAVPYEYRDAIKEGILMWNKAFLKAGFKDAIEARQMPDNATWDPADIRYNTIRWINTIDGFFARGPSRVNPLTGEILDADILVDGSFVRVLKNEYRQIVQPNQVQGRTSLTALMQGHALCANKLSKKAENNPQQQQKPMLRRLAKMAGESDLCYGIEAANQFALGAMAMTLLEDTTTTKEQLKEYIHQYLRLIIAHEVGHTLGLRHNFRGSNLLQPEEMNDKQITTNKGLTASVMDYIPPNIAPQGTKQGDYFPSMVGPYDDWAIQYGYMPTQASTPIAEKPILDEIASQSDRPELSYSTDEDRYDLDPTANAWDNSNNVLRYAQWQLDNSRVMWDRLNKRYPVAGESYSDLSDRFGSVLGNYFQNIFYTTKYIGGQSFYRVHAGELPSKAGVRQRRLPFEPVPVEKQRQALETLQKYVFAEDAFNFSPELLNKLAPSRWYHWGSYPLIGRLDYPIHDLVLTLQSAVLVDLLSGDRLSRLKDIELKSPQGKALSLPELFDTLQNGIWTEVLKPQGKTLKISSLRRGLQREYVNILSDIVLRREYVPEDARTLAWYKIRQLNEKLAGVNSDDEYTKAHILETRDRIEKILNAPLRSN
ncbi:zinc-dependent metalloprotease [Tolypothrix sp. FACHB-123]|uniref:zinc-dependent metalloprotease n=1 Tax=Tolypothrix sp. FACHB-123 TaxID=2692868 RepID=UPI001684F4F5|nr:zinc-dependent metalloprotease [Tolypothrix sp. FACHB-123]MBD2354106.1 zinc-dependent metalloprotease [Tolypothrix sp. FACHB-123]